MNGGGTGEELSLLSLDTAGSGEGGPSLSFKFSCGGGTGFTPLSSETMSQHLPSNDGGVLQSVRVWVGSTAC